MTSTPVTSHSVPLVGGARLPLAFIVFGLAAHLAGAVWLVVQPGLLLEAHLHPRVVTLAHLWLPGFLLSVCVGAVYQLMPVVLGTALRAGSVRLWLHSGLHAVGCPLLIAGFPAGRFDWVAAGGTAVSLGVVLLAIAVVNTFRASPRRDAPAWSFPLAAIWLLATVLLGVVLALNRLHPFLPVSALGLLRAHAHLGLVGFFFTLLQGATFQLVPMFTMGTLRRPRWVVAGLLGTQTGLLILAPGLAWHAPLPTLVGAALIAAGLAASGVALGATLRHRRRRVLEPGLRAFVIGGALLGAAVLTGLVLVAAPGHSAFLRRLVSAYGVLAIAGALGLCVSGMLCKIVPFLVWMRAYGPKVGRQPVPIATELSSKPLERLWLIAHLAGAGLLIAAILGGAPSAVIAGAWTLLGATLVFLVNIARILAHLRPGHAGAVFKKNLQPS
ncbi:MAG: hypothetical protein ABII82_20650 [Verrucomicrobiota bacterium]